MSRLPPFALRLAHMAAYVVATCVFLWPLTSAPGSLMPNTRWFYDAHFVLFAAETSVDNLFTPGVHRFDSLALYPLPRALLTSEHLLLVGFLLKPLLLLTTRAGAYNALLVLFLASGGYALDRFARRLGASPWAAALAGGLFAFSPIHLFHLARLQVLGIACFPLAWHALVAWREAPTARRGLWFGCAMALPAFFNLYFLVFCGLTVALFLGAYEAARPTPRLSLAHVRTALAALPPLALAIAYNAPYAYDLGPTGGRARVHASLTGWVGQSIDFVRADALSRAWGWLAIKSKNDGWSSFPGGLALWCVALVALAPDARGPWLQALGLMCLRGLLFAGGWAAAYLTHRFEPMVLVWVVGAVAIAHRRRQLGREPAGALYYALATVGIACFLMFHGPRFLPSSVPGAPTFETPWATLSRLLPSLGGARALRRFNIPLLAAALALGSLALTRMVGALPRRRRQLAVAALFGAAALDVMPGPIPTRPWSDVCDEPVWRELAVRKDGKPLFVFPFTADEDGTMMMEATRCHGHPTANGHTSVRPAGYDQMERLAMRVATPAACDNLVASMQQMHIGWVVLDGRARKHIMPATLGCLESHGARVEFHDRCSLLLSLGVRDAPPGPSGLGVPTDLDCKRGPDWAAP